MERLLELYSDGRVYEMVDGQAVRVTETQGQVAALLQALRFSVATTFQIAPPGQPPPDVIERRGSRRMNQAGLNLLTSFEGCELAAYDDGGGVWTIGYGHTQDVYPGMTITQAQAEQWLLDDLDQFETYVEDAVNVSLNENQFSALVCFCFNVGPGAEGFGGSTLLRLLNQGNYAGAADQFPVWNKVDGEPWLGLTRRRLAERSLFLSQPWQPFLTYTGDGTVASRTLKRTQPAMQGEDVRQIQTALLKAGFSLGADGADGYFGPATEQAVKQFQQKTGLAVDGVVGNETRKHLGLAV